MIFTTTTYRGYGTYNLKDTAHLAIFYLVNSRHFDTVALALVLLTKPFQRRN